MVISPAPFKLISMVNNKKPLKIISNIPQGKRVGKARGNFQEGQFHLIASNLLAIEKDL